MNILAVVRRDQAMNAQHEEIPRLLTENLRPLHHQVAGHVYNKKKAKLGFLECGDGTILKPFQDDQRGENESIFYQTVFDRACTSQTLLKLRKVIPKFYGVYPLPGHLNVKCLHLEDLTARMARPCVADIKLGRRTYDPLADPEKIAREEAKYPPAKILGFQPRGMRIYDTASDSFTVHGKELRRYDQNTIQEAFRIFFSNGGGLRKDAVQATLEQLCPIRTWFQQQTELSFYACSLLVVYEGKKPTGKESTTGGAKNTQNGTDDNQENLLNEKTGVVDYLKCPESSSKCSDGSLSKGDDAAPVTCSDSAKSGEKSQSDSDYGIEGAKSDKEGVNDVLSECECPVVVRLIDFTHVFPVNHVDENNLHGIQTFMSLLEKLLEG